MYIIYIASLHKYYFRNLPKKKKTSPGYIRARLLSKFILYAAFYIFLI